MLFPKFLLEISDSSLIEMALILCHSVTLPLMHWDREREHGLCKTFKNKVTKTDTMYTPATNTHTQTPQSVSPPHTEQPVSAQLCDHPKTPWPSWINRHQIPRDAATKTNQHPFSFNTNIWLLPWSYAASLPSLHMYSEPLCGVWHYIIWKWRWKSGSWGSCSNHRQAVFSSCVWGSQIRMGQRTFQGW